MQGDILKLYTYSVPHQILLIHFIIFYISYLFKDYVFFFLINKVLRTAIVTGPDASELHREVRVLY